MTKKRINIGTGKDVQIGDRIYQGMDAETIKAALWTVCKRCRSATVQQRPQECNLDMNQ